MCSLCLAAYNPWYIGSREYYNCYGGGCSKDMSDIEDYDDKYDLKSNKKSKFYSMYAETIYNTIQ